MPCSARTNDSPSGSGETFVLGCYVDNFQICHSAELDSSGAAVDKSSFYHKFHTALLLDWSVVDEGPMVDLLGIQAVYHKSGHVTLHQADYIDKMLARFLPSGRPSQIPAATLPYSKKFEARLIAALAGSTPHKPAYPELVKPCQERIGSLMYLCRSTRPDICFPVHQLAQAMSRPTPEIMDELDHIFVYLARHRDVGITYSPIVDEFRGLSDASWEVRNSTSGRLMLWCAAAISWASKKQNCIALSSCEAEIVALSDAAKDVVFFRRFLRGINRKFINGPTSLGTDNMGARDISYNPTNHDRMKHVERRHYFVRDMVESFEIEVPYVSTHD